MAITVLAGQIVLADDFNKLAPTAARKTADETVNNITTFQNDDQLAVAVTASATYQIEGVVHYNTGTTPDIKLQWTYPTGLTMSYVLEGFAVGTTALGLFRSTEATVQILEGDAGNRVTTLDGVVIVGSTAGTLQLQWAQNTATVADTKVLSGSYITLTRLS